MVISRMLAAMMVSSALMLALGANVAFAGEWNKPNGDVAAKQQGRSDCLFNGLDQPDDVVVDGGEGPGPEGYDDGLWSITPAGAHSGGAVRVQSGGQLTAFLGFPVGQGEACNGHLNPINVE